MKYGEIKSLEIECDVDKDGALDMLEVRRFNDNHCDHKEDQTYEVRPYECSKSPWLPGKYVKFTFTPPPTFLEALAVVGIVFGCVSLICCTAILCRRNRKRGVRHINTKYSE